jgi:hypothetical protein
MATGRGPSHRKGNRHFCPGGNDGIRANRESPAGCCSVIGAHISTRHPGTVRWTPDHSCSGFVAPASSVEGRGPGATAVVLNRCVPPPLPTLGAEEDARYDGAWSSGLPPALRARWNPSGFRAVRPVHDHCPPAVAVLTRYLMWRQGVEENRKPEVRAGRRWQSRSGFIFPRKLSMMQTLG